ncbi:nephrin [Nephila pilipes]|uniref:Nephrin n=1 Tax=Nephila pilipes TaxID=299642 RepID=A0A8X6QD69_NEPPI|nr:nephrin [Nephila pilipes]
MNITQHSFRLECAEGSNGGLRQHFVMEVHDTQLHRLRGNHSADTPIFVVRDLPPGTGFVVVVYAVNAKGRSQAVVLRVTTQSARQADNRKGALHRLLQFLALILNYYAFFCFKNPPPRKF